MISLARRFLFLSLLVWASSGAGFGATREMCADAKTQAQLTRCWANAAKGAEQKLDAAYRKLAQRLQRSGLTDEAKAMEDGQSAWTEYRDKHCGAVQNVFGSGSAAAMYSASCRARLAESRTREVESLMRDLQGLGGDGPKR